MFKCSSLCKTTTQVQVDNQNRSFVMKIFHSFLTLLTKSCEHSLMWKGGGAEGRLRAQWEVVIEGVKGCQKGGIAGRVFLLQYHINCIVLSLLLKICFVFFYIDRRRKEMLKRFSCWFRCVIPRVKLYT